MPSNNGSCAKGDLLEVSNLKKYFPILKGVFSRSRDWLKAVDDISFSIGINETFGMVGESGCGKSTTAKVILRLIEPTEGKIFFENKDITNTPEKKLQFYRRSVQVVLQDPWSSLNPRHRVGTIISEPMKNQKIYSKQDEKDRLSEVLELVGLKPGHSSLFPHEFSGGQRQRIAIARALTTNPKLIILDEPISSLDVSIRAQIINLLMKLQEKLGVSYMLIAHDLAVILHMSSKVGVMYSGKMVEYAGGKDLYKYSLHPYTRGLFATAFRHQLCKKELNELLLKGEINNSTNLIMGCQFRPRCNNATAVCSESEPGLREVAHGHLVACHQV